MSFDQYYAWIKVQLQTIVYKLLTFVKSIYKKLFNKLYETNDPINWDLRSNSNNQKIRIMVNLDNLGPWWKYLFHELQEDKDFDEVRDEEPSDEEEGVEADTTMTLQGGVRYFSFGFFFVPQYLLPLISRGWCTYLHVLHVFLHLPVQDPNFI